MTVETYIGVGSNIKPEANLLKALRLLQEHVTVTAVATVYRTEAIGRSGQPDFLNTVWQIRTDVPPRTLKFDILRNIEAKLGRIRTADRYAPRPIDLDILLYGDDIVRTAELRIPDPDIRQRPFLAIPVWELTPDLILPDSHETLQSVVSKFDLAALEPVAEMTTELQRILQHE